MNKLKVNGVLLTEGTFDSISGKYEIQSGTLKKTFNNIKNPLRIGFTHDKSDIYKDFGLDSIGECGECFLDNNKIIFSEIYLNDNVNINNIKKMDSINLSINGFYKNYVENEGVVIPDSLFIDGFDFVGLGACPSCRINFEDKINIINLGSVLKMVEENKDEIDNAVLLKQNEELSQKIINLEKELSESKSKYDEYVKSEHKLELSKTVNAVRDELKEEIHLELTIEKLVNDGVILAKDKDLHFQKAKLLGLSEYEKFMKSCTPMISLGVKYKSPSELGLSTMGLNSYNKEKEEIIEEYRLNMSMNRLPPYSMIPQFVIDALDIKEEGD